MTTVIPKSAWITLYKQLQKEASKLEHYNYRTFAHRRIRDHFEANKKVTSPEALQKLFEKGQENLAIIKRQAVIQNLFPHKHTVVEEKVAKEKTQH